MQLVVSILEGNAQEIGHLTNQLILTRDQLREVSTFLECSNEDTPTNYNTKLERMRSVLRDIPHHETFIDNLRDMPVVTTTKTVLLTARYLRRGPPSDFGKPIPAIFERNISIMGSRQIISPRCFYTIIKPIGYNFLPILEEDGMTFVLREIADSNKHIIFRST